MILGIAVHAEITTEQLAGANNALKAAIALDNKCTTAADCSVIAVGARACGGPSGYLAYATKCSNALDVQLMAQLTNHLEAQYNLENSVVSICSIVMPPGVACDATKKCVTSSSSSTPDIQ